MSCWADPLFWDSIGIGGSNPTWSLSDAHLCLLHVIEYLYSIVIVGGKVDGFVVVSAFPQTQLVERGHHQQMQQQRVNDEKVARPLVREQETGQVERELLGWIQGIVSAVLLLYTPCGWSAKTCAHSFITTCLFMELCKWIHALLVQFAILVRGVVGLLFVDGASSKASHGRAGLVHVDSNRAVLKAALMSASTPLFQHALCLTVMPLSCCCPSFHTCTNLSRSYRFKLSVLSFCTCILASCSDVSRDRTRSSSSLFLCLNRSRWLITMGRMLLSSFLLPLDPSKSGVSAPSGVRGMGVPAALLLSASTILGSELDWWPMPSKSSSKRWTSADFSCSFCSSDCMLLAFSSNARWRSAKETLICVYSLSSFLFFSISRTSRLFSMVPSFFNTSSALKSSSSSPVENSTYFETWVGICFVLFTVKEKRGALPSWSAALASSRRSPRNASSFSWDSLFLRPMRFDV